MTEAPTPDDDALDGEPPTPAFVKICEIGPGAGLRREATPLPTAAKIRYVDCLSRAGLAAIETAAFLDERRFPALADAEAVFAGVARAPGVAYAALVADEAGLARALACEARALALETAASEAFAREAQGASIDAALGVFAGIAREARRGGLFVRVAVAAAFGCPYAGDVPPEDAAAVAERLAEYGVDEIVLVDTIGVATPEAVASLARLLQERIPVERLAMRFHDRQPQALAHVAAAYAAGVRTFDAASGGVGECPYAPGACGNLETEDVVGAFAERDVPTGVDGAAVRAAAESIREALRAARA